MPVLCQASAGFVSPTGALQGASGDRSSSGETQYQVVQERHDRVVMRIIPKREPTREEIAEVEDRSDSRPASASVCSWCSTRNPGALSGKFSAYRSLVKSEND